ncbi:hypothetical protein ERO13_A09G138550v2 [Gossypium hirsutum]|uniref:Uncharacterized protein n=1 Tax=Gossypium mustelinum TaxID=34275 RepID=A0A5D2XY52_GOSMU|nr:hypothetical protein ERO13_A09G138550v2 [Gossypium hirsutum]TYJ18825.1 hypothetical protein E1A91_A09G149000v1 [Gossypium mustelinum]KAG4183914.1 hypothetical protein ERO13_A09G138550v2 [Gossypium hirsutum]TYJ18826.1 hypothetical protein E1A91_A09G149000v1 [Gossypium mustelinum]TYJ18827.1 hypothetical protein E1A91_A09G149000v1 [Gossypium mustelinum]
MFKLHVPIPSRSQAILHSRRHNHGVGATCLLFLFDRMGNQYQKIEFSFGSSFCTIMHCSKFSTKI